MKRKRLTPEDVREALALEVNDFFILKWETEVDLNGPARTHVVTLKIGRFGQPGDGYDERLQRRVEETLYIMGYRGKVYVDPWVIPAHHRPHIGRQQARTCLHAMKKAADNRFDG